MCRYGRSCRFSHDAQTSSSRPAQPQQAPTTDSRLAKYKTLLKEASVDYTSVYYSRQRSLPSAFAIGLEILDQADGDGAKQEVITLLASENGLSCIRNVAEVVIPTTEANGTHAKAQAWESHLGPLFRLITHSSVVRSNLLEEKVFQIYTFLAGIGLGRLSALLRFILDLAEAADRPPTLSRIGLVEPTLAVLAKMLDANTSLIINDTFCTYAEAFIAAANKGAISESPQDGYARVQACHQAAFISRRLKVGETIPDAHSAAHPVPAGRLPMFRLRKDLPGLLSSDGPRHDNDHANIARISIMPTRDELSSTRDEYLPTIDTETWHHKGILGRLDREFRLLREDTVGQLRDVVRTELERLRSQSSNTHYVAAKGSDNIRYCTYQNAMVHGVDFERRMGAEFLVRFRQPASQSRKTSQPEIATDDRMSLLQRREWWMGRAMKRLQPGGLVCAIESQGSALFFKVAESTLRTGDEKRKYHGQDTNMRTGGKKHTLADDATHSFVRLVLATPEHNMQLSDGLEWLFQTKTKQRPPQKRVLVEFPGILLDSFLHTLKALQATSRTLNVPFADVLAPDADGDSGDGGDGSSPETGRLVGVPPPRYMKQPGFVFDLGGLTTSDEELQHSLQNPLSPDEVCENTRLDKSQAVALLEALSRSLALIQGPPGTGKTVVGVDIVKVLLDNQEKADLGPIVIICYTNHALDQILEHILDARPGVNMIRMGSGSKTERLKNLNLREVAFETNATKIEKQAKYEAREKLNLVAKKIQALIFQLGYFQPVQAVEGLLFNKHPGLAKELFKRNNSDEAGSGWKQVHEDPTKTLRHWLAGGSNDSSDGGVQGGTISSRETFAQTRQRLRAAMDAGTLNLWGLTGRERDVLYQTWQAEAFQCTKNEVMDSYRHYVPAKKAFDRATREVDLRCLQQADVVGVTTTGLARSLDLLRHLPSKVLMCEEAGEVLEAHILTSLLPSVQHAILIGDHEQLRPQVQNYGLSSDNPRGRQFSFDISLFERLVLPPRIGAARLPFSHLTTQRRMHPSISALIRAPLYPELEDGGDVAAYPTVPGVARRLFWLDHPHLEDGVTADGGGAAADPTNTSRTNAFEVEMTAALVSHLVKQGTYKSGEIAVLTPYLGQMLQLQRKLSSMFEITLNERDQEDLDAAAAAAAAAAFGSAAQSAQGKKKEAAPAKTLLSHSVRIATVDNFQGEEAKVVVVSLVRSNPQRRCGFLRTSNRINVLLSRAQHGMFILGNRETCSDVPMWQDVSAMLEADGNLGPALPLCCQQHPEQTFEASIPDHFAQFAPDGGCLLPCVQRLACGHACTQRCHSEVIHAAVRCTEPCTRPLAGCDHGCPRKCGDDCVLRCTVELTGQTLTLPCGHTRTGPYCWEWQAPASVKCHAKVKQTVPECGHVLTVTCGVDVADASFRCKAECRSALACGHNCKKACFVCKPRDDEGMVANEDHGSCEHRCGRPFGTCQHTCPEKCHGDAPCPPCNVRCDVWCSHSRCSAKCNEPCPPCAEETCASRCPHSACTMPCAAPCNWVPCSKRCAKLLACGHQCPTVCGELCPDKRFCQTCGSADVLDQQVDWILMSTYREIDLDEDPCIIPRCGHMLSVSSMDGLMDMGRHYTMAETGSGQAYPVAVAASSAPFDMREAKQCPTCRGPLRDVARYGRIVRRALLDEATKRFIQWANQEHTKLANTLVDEREWLSSAEDVAVPANTAHKSRKLPKTGERQGLIKTLLNAVQASTRYDRVFKIRQDIVAHELKVAKDEQPFQKVVNLVRFAQRRQAKAQDGTDAPPATQFTFDESVLQVRGLVLAKLLLLRCDILALEDLGALLEKRQQRARWSATESAVPSLLAALIAGKRFDVLFEDCSKAIAAAKAATCVRQEVEGHVCYAQLCVAVRKLASNAKAGKGSGTAVEEVSLPTQLKEKGLEHVAAARARMATHASTRVLEVEADAADAALRELPEYQAVTVEELRAVHAAMATEFRGSGHWYVCANNHPFTVGECGMPMEEARCPECGAAVGGRNHIPVAGVQHATAIEAMGREGGAAEREG